MGPKRLDSWKQLRHTNPTPEDNERLQCNVLKQQREEGRRQKCKNQLLLLPQTVELITATVCTCNNHRGSIFILLLLILYVVSRQLWCLHVPVSPLAAGTNETVHDHTVWFSNDANNNNNNNNNLCNLINTHWKDKQRRTCGAFMIHSVGENRKSENKKYLKTTEIKCEINIIDPLHENWSVPAGEIDL